MNSQDFTKISEPYNSQLELLENFSSLMDLNIYYCYKYHSWVGPENNLQNMMGLVVTREEFERNLLRARDTVIGAELLPAEREEISGMQTYLRLRINATKEAGKKLPLLELSETFGLEEFEQMIILALLCCETDKKYEKLFAYMQDDITKKSPTVETLIRLFGAPDVPVFEYYTYFGEERIIVKFLTEGADAGAALCTRQLKLRTRILDYFLGDETGSGLYKEGLFEAFVPSENLHPLYIDEFAGKRIDAAADRCGGDKTMLMYIKASKGSGKRFQIKHAAKRCGKRVLFVKSKALFTEDGDVRGELNHLLCERLMFGGWVCFTDFEQLTADEEKGNLAKFVTALNENSAYFGPAMFICSEQDWSDCDLSGDFIKLDLRISDADEEGRMRLWESFLQDLDYSDDITPAEMAGKFRFTPGQIEAAVMQAADIAKITTGKIDAVLLHECCYNQVVIGLNTLAKPVKPAYSWDDLVLPDAEVRMLKEACTHVKYRHTVYNEWNFKKKAAYGRGLSILFSGPPGTGKTMAAQVVTNQLHMQMYKVQLSQVVSKYIGETEKNLKQVFTEAKNANCILFFDETDALFGKRSEVKDSHDRHANIETAYLLQQMEEYDGVVLMATNLLQNIDEAFMRRINFVIAFPFPDVPTRKLLWKKLIDTDAPISDDVDFDFLAENFKIAGGNIKNCVVHAAFLAAAESSAISMRHLVRSVVNEQRKSNIVVLKEDLKEYADLVFGAQEQ